MGARDQAVAFTDTPIYHGLLRDVVRRDAVAYIASLSATAACPDCGARSGAPCVTATGNRARAHHKGRRWS